MTDMVTIFKCAHCHKPFSYIPSDEDFCRPGTPNQICDECARELEEEDERE